MRLAGDVAAGTSSRRALLRVSQLVALDKILGVRPIAAGEIFYCLATRAVLFSAGLHGLLPNQLGVGNPGGVDPAIHLMREAVEGDNLRGYERLTQLDFSNAVNTVSRKAMAEAVRRFRPDLVSMARWAYDEPSLLITVESNRLVSTEGADGSPWSHEKVIAYLDDLLVAGRRTEVLDKATEILDDMDIGVSLNLSKSKVSFVQDCRASSGIAVHGSLGPEPARRAFLAGRIAQQTHAHRRMGRLSRQQALLALRVCTQQGLRHLVRTLRPDGLDDLWAELDAHLLKVMRWIRGVDAPVPHDNDIMALPTRLGGMGIPFYLEQSHAVYPVTVDIAQAALATIVTLKSPP
ncbi:uncharacterized protein BROUX77_002528 [Berkeleyomyces rouxiae]|uniref:uncharacterized protein n=1 Tax=Berkeleyomyces rouxiae TaxID=2035830 RepID=UPI003B7A648B